MPMINAKTWEGSRRELITCPRVETREQNLEGTGPYPSCEQVKGCFIQVVV